MAVVLVYRCDECGTEEVESESAQDLLKLSPDRYVPEG